MRRSSHLAIRPARSARRVGRRPVAPMVAVGFAVLVAALPAPGCGDGGGGGPSPDASSSDGATVPTRSYVLAGVAQGYTIDATPSQTLSIETLGAWCRTEDPPDGSDAAPTEVCTPAAEALVLPVDTLGIPWASFDSPTGPSQLPGAWLSRLTEMEDVATASGLDVVLRLSPVSGAHDALAPEATEQAGTLVLDPTWRPYCYDPSQDGNPTRWRDAYARYVSWMVSRVQPRWVVLGDRLNRFEENCTEPVYRAVAEYVSHADAELKAAGLTTTTLATVDVEDLYGYPKQPGRCVQVAPKDCLAERVALLDAFRADRLGLVTAPAVAMADLGSLPTDWLRAAADASGWEGIDVLGAGVPALPVGSLEGTLCPPLVEGTEAQQRALLDQVIGLAEAESSELATWTSGVDLLPTEVTAACPCPKSSAFELCSHFEFRPSPDVVRLEALGGLWASDGTARSAATLWLSVLAQP